MSRCCWIAFIVTTVLKFGFGFFSIIQVYVFNLIFLAVELSCLVISLLKAFNDLCMSSSYCLWLECCLSKCFCGHVRLCYSVAKTYDFSPLAMWACLIISDQYGHAGNKNNLGDLWESSRRMFGSNFAACHCLDNFYQDELRYGSVWPQTFWEWNAFKWLPLSSFERPCMIS